MYQQLTKFEKVRVIGQRAEQISRGAPILIPNVSEFNDAIQIAEEEYRLNKIPFIVKRELPDGKEISIKLYKS